METHDNLFELVGTDHEKAENIGYDNYSYWQSTFKTFLKSKIALISLFIIVSIITITILELLFGRHDPYKTVGSILTSGKSIKNMGPSTNYWFGTDGLGRDLWARCWHGVSVSLSLAFIVTIINFSIGVIVGGLWGYYRQVDRFFTELYTLLTSIPTTIRSIMIAYVLGRGFWTLVFVLTCVGWISWAYYIRNLTIIYRDREFNLASRCLGTPALRVVLKNYVPHMISLIVFNLALAIPSVIGIEIILTFLGVGMDLTVASLGGLVSEGSGAFTVYPHLMLAPVAITALVTISFALMGNKFSDATDPRNHI